MFCACCDVATSMPDFGRPVFRAPRDAARPSPHACVRPASTRAPPRTHAAPSTAERVISSIKLTDGSQQKRFCICPGSRSQKKTACVIALAQRARHNSRSTGPGAIVAARRRRSGVSAAMLRTDLSLQGPRPPCLAARSRAHRDHARRQRPGGTAGISGVARSERRISSGIVPDTLFSVPTLTPCS